MENAERIDQDQEDVKRRSMDHIISYSMESNVGVPKTDSTAMCIGKPTGLL